MPFYSKGGFFNHGAPFFLDKNWAHFSFQANLNGPEILINIVSEGILKGSKKVFWRVK